MTDYVDTNEPGLPISSIGHFAKKYPQFKTLRPPLTAGVMAYIGAAEYTDNADGDRPTGNAVLIDGTYYREYRAFTADELAAGEVSWVASELSAADIEILKHDDGHGRVTATKPQWRTYRNALRDHVIGGVVQGARPTKPE
jgi:hypothetical protein